MKRIHAVLFDMIGTTVLEKDPTVISSCFENAFLENAVKIDRDQIRHVRGMDKMEAIRLILKSSGRPLELQSQIFEAFENNVKKNLSNFVEHPESPTVFNQLRKNEIRLGIASGFPMTLFQMMFEKFAWAKNSFDYINVYENFPNGRPDPAMIVDMCEKLQVGVSKLLKVGDTVADIQEGKNAGSITAAVLAGTQPDSMLRAANPDFILNSLGDVIKVVN